MPGLEDLTSDQLLARARATEGSHSLISALLNDPASREIVQRQLKRLQPSLVIPEIDTKDKFQVELEKEREARQKLEGEILQDKVRARLEGQRSAAKATYRLSDTDMTEVEKLMTDPENPIPTYDAASRVFNASKKTGEPTPSSFSPPVFSMPENDTWGKGIGNKSALDKIAMTEAYAAINDIRSGKVAGMGPAVQN
jgi:hypothetical protein